MDHLYALIMAGGGGTRLWPLSRKTRPKQLLPLVEERSMFHASVERLAPRLTPERVFVVTGQDQAAQLQADAPQVPVENYIVEPFGQNTGPAVGLAIMHIQQRDPEAVIAVLTADHHIADQEKFRRVVVAAAEQAAEGFIVTLGISPSFPATGYGYIRRGAALTQRGEFQIYHADAFTEKPGLETATEFVLSGLYSWNSGMFIFQAKQLVTEYARQQPEMHGMLQTIRAAIGTPDYEAVLADNWPQMPRLSIDYAVMEHAEHMAVIPVDMGWSDIGSWATLYDVLEGDGAGNVSRGSNGVPHIYIDTKNSLIFSKRMVATIGLEDIVIVDTDDILLICHRNRSQDVRQIVEQLKQSGDDTHL
jgi:mannose-1-phosphate guanylyltransferase